MCERGGRGRPLRQAPGVVFGNAGRNLWVGRALWGGASETEAGGSGAGSRFSGGQMGPFGNRCKCVHIVRVGPRVVHDRSVAGILQRDGIVRNLTLPRLPKAPAPRSAKEWVWRGRRG